MTGLAVGGLVQAATAPALAALAMALVLAFVRVLRGPTLADRVVALDVLTTAVAAAVIVWTIRFGNTVLLHPALALAVVAFLGTVAFARYVEKREDR